MGALSVVQRRPARANSMSAVHRTAAIEATTGRRPQRSLPARQPENVWQRSPTAIAQEEARAALALAAQTRLTCERQTQHRACASESGHVHR